MIPVPADRSGDDRLLFITGARPVILGGYEVWAMTDNGLIAESRGYFDEAEYQLQLEHG